MDFKPSQTNSAPANGNPQPAASRFGAGGNGIGGLHPDGGNTKKIILAVVIAFAIIVVGGLGLWGYKQMNTTSNAIKPDLYQALFLSNGQVYFGKLTNVGEKYVKLTDIYYLQVQQAVQPPDNKAKDQQQQPQVSLAKLGNELHGPEDSMWVNRDQVLFWENLKNDGKVVKAIQENAKK